MSVSENATRAEAALAARSLHAEGGDGANGVQEAFIDEHSIQSNDGRSRTHTMFYWWEATPERQTRFKKLAKWNDGVQDQERKERNWHQGKLNDARLFCEHLGLSDTETHKVVEMADTIDFSQFGSYTVEQVLVGCCSLVADENTDTFEDRIITTDEFKELMEVVHIGTTEHNRIRRAIRDRTPYF